MIEKRVWNKCTSIHFENPLFLADAAKTEMSQEKSENWRNQVFYILE
jgi:hypothetical protein